MSAEQRAADLAPVVSSPEPVPASARPKVLLAEDDRFLRKAARAALERKGWEVVVAANGEEAVEAASRGDVSLVLLDLILPKLNGFEVLLRLKANAATADVPVIVLTNLGQYSDIQRARQQGAAGYMIKGEMDLGELVARVETVLAGQKPR